MANFADSTDIATLRTALAGYVTSITHDDSDTQTILRAKAQLALDRYADAEGAVNTLNAAANQSYSNGLGFSVNKKRLDDATAAASAAWDGFVRVCGMGDVTVPSMGEDAVAYWDLSGGMA